MELISDYLKAFTFPLETHEYDPGIAVFFLDRDFSKRISDVAGSYMQLDEKWVILLLKWLSLEPWTYMIICEYKFFILQVLSSIYMNHHWRFKWIRHYILFPNYTSQEGGGSHWKIVFAGGRGDPWPIFGNITGNFTKF